MAIHCFYHSADLDGHCSGATVKYKHPEAVMHLINYGDEFPWGEIREKDTVFMVDFCLQPEDQMYKLCVHHCGEVYWIDHHYSAIKAVEEIGLYPLGKRDITKAACELTWEYLFPDRPVPLAVKMLSLYDSWTYQGHELEEIVLPFQMRMRMEQLDPKDWDHAIETGDTVGDIWEALFHCDLSTQYLYDLILEGRLLLRYDEEQKRKYVKTYGFEAELSIPVELELTGGYAIIKRKAIAVNLGHTNSKVFDSVWDATKYDLMLTFCRRSDRLWNVSLYSTKPDIDCGAIAKPFGGGGHKGAAGFQCEYLPFEY